MLEEKGIPFLALCHFIRGQEAGRLFWFYRLGTQPRHENIKPLSKIDELIEEMCNADRPPLFIYKIHGTTEWLAAWGDASEDFSDAVCSRIRMRTPSERELRRSMTEPSRREGSVTVDADLAEQLLRDLRR